MSHPSRGFHEIFHFWNLEFHPPVINSSGSDDPPHILRTYQSRLLPAAMLSIFRELSSLSLSRCRNRYIAKCPPRMYFSPLTATLCLPRFHSQMAPRQREYPRAHPACNSTDQSPLSYSPGTTSSSHRPRTQNDWADNYYGFAVTKEARYWWD